MEPGVSQDVLRGHLPLRLVAGDGLVLRPVVHEHPADVLDPGDGQHIPQEDEEPGHPLQQAHHEAAFDAEKAHHQGREHHEQAHGQGRRQDHRHGHGHIPGGLAQLLREPLLELGGLLGHVLPQQFRAAGGDLHAAHQGLHEGVDPPDHGPGGEGPLLMLVLVLIVFSDDSAVALAHGQGGAVLGVLHHDPLHDGLAAHGASLHRRSFPPATSAGAY